ncbi:uncharacterized protein LOC126894692 [Daktulosphaira vitifoliae]|uniref:uncharacterized protein LOC126894692 n=1 Tax=Daktulosphaira vitifoliae TaxID=58002 RepID=UPI0021AB08EC|nr:uncharacterized protein LOC126894692 [Daktulosphaira vitifoliae]XP_050521846.1 uncharacterized protein LOC126894692 [Daktulosphaira vitifoliae]XP_050521847.1 uncharacterized protein LOC126894692 [Daktulosphaira vitifoliae]XP_050521848.1 uncharacterized protein LOC126894692 [Daktulosphaira vitifoliae]XP_050521849.1 uncharacterized protein LOC126894692 [Daktulosphaira vitifoliae]
MDLKEEIKISENDILEENWIDYESYLERNGVTGAIFNVLNNLFEKDPWPNSPYQYFYEKLGECSEMRVTRNKIRKKYSKLINDLKSITNEIEFLLLIRDNGLKLSLYKDFVNNLPLSETYNIKNKKVKQNKIIQ